MTQLKLLIIDSAGYLHDLRSLPTSLKVLHCWDYRLKTLPLADQQYDFVEINLIVSSIEQLWHGKKFLEKLTRLDLTGYYQLKQTPDLSDVPRLQTLVLKYCESLTEVHPPLVHHKSLTQLDLSLCTTLEALPGKLEMSSLNELILDNCFRFENPSEFGECMKSLSRLSLKEISIKKLPTSLGCLVGLEDLNLHGCKNLECLPDITNGLKSLNILSAGNHRKLPLLRTLELSFCCLTEESFPLDFGHFPSLMDLDLSGNSFVSIPMSIRELPKLKCLKLNCCYSLRCLPKFPSSIQELEACQCYSLDISEFNILSNVCGAFVPKQDHGQVLLEMVVPGNKIPSWFVHREDGNSVSIPCDYPLNVTLGIALCCLIHERALISSLNGDNRFITNEITPICVKGSHLYIICLTNDYFDHEFHQGTCIEFSIEHLKKLSVVDKHKSSEVLVISTDHCGSLGEY